MFGPGEKEITELLIYGGAAVGGLVVLVILLKMLGGKGKKGHKDLEKTQHERLDEYPKAPSNPGGKRLVIDGIDVRVRLVVFAPVGTEKRPIDVDEAPEMLDNLLRGLGGFIKSDKPRVRVWPPQLSVAGWPPTFFRLVESPDEEYRKSNWIRVAGTIKIVGKPHLLGLALYSDEASTVGTMILEPTEWTRHLQIEK
jgi:hypothetical protein